MITVFLAVDLAWLFFRASDTRTAFLMINQICQGLKIEETGGECLRTGITLLQVFFMGIGLVCMAIVDVMHVRKIRIRKITGELPIAVRWVLYYGVIMTLLVIMIANMGMDNSNFIYGQF